MNVHEGSEQNFKSIFDNSLDGILIVDPKTLKFLVGNRMIYKLLGYGIGEIKNLSIKDLHLENDLSHIIELFQEQDGTEIKTIRDTPVKRKDGSIFFADIYSHDVLIDGLKYRSYNCREISERKLVEEALHESEKRLNETQQITKIGSWELDLKTNELKWSDESYRLFELDPKTSRITYETFINAVYPDEREFVRKAYLDSVKNKTPYDVVHRLRIKDGSIRYINLRCQTFYDGIGNPVRSIGTIQDITQLKQEQEKRDRLAKIVETSSDFIGIADYDGHLHYINPTGRKMIGISLNEDTSRLYVLSLFTENAYNVFMNEAVPTAMESGVWVGEMVMKGAQGKEIPVSQALVAYKSPEGNIEFFFTIARDITERKRAEQELRLARDEALRASRVKSDFLTAMSHELRTPLNSIMGFSDLLRKKHIGGLNEKQDQYIDNIYSSGTNLLRIINDILDIVKVEYGEKLQFSIEVFPVQKAIEEILFLVGGRAEKKNIVVKKELDPILSDIRADKVRFKQIFFYLLDNAIKFSKPEGGTVTIAAKKEQNMAQFSVTDTGIGIKGEDISKLFGLFYQAEAGLSRGYGGTGIGLAITKQVVEQLGGKIWVESKYGEGSKFTFTLPLDIK